MLACFRKSVIGGAVARSAAASVTPPSLLPERALQLPTTGASSTGVAMGLAPWAQAN